MHKRRQQLLATMILLGVACIGGVGWLVWRNGSATGSSVAYETTTLRVDGQAFVLDIADTPAKQNLGLGKRSTLAADRGMVFPYDSAGQRCFWMKDMRFAIDILWLDAQKLVGHIEKSVSPDSYPQTYCPDMAAQYVVELPAGVADKAGIKTGDTLPLDL